MVPPMRTLDPSISKYIVRAILLAVIVPAPGEGGNPGSACRGAGRGRRASDDGGRAARTSSAFGTVRSSRFRVLPQAAARRSEVASATVEALERHSDGRGGTDALAAGPGSRVRCSLAIGPRRIGRALRNRHFTTLWSSGARPAGILGRTLCARGL